VDYEIISLIFVALFVLVYVVFLAALAWWGLRPRLRPALKSVRLLSSEVARRACFDDAGETRSTQIENWCHNGYKARRLREANNAKESIPASGVDCGSYQEIEMQQQLV
jgi:hypothetical protein